MQGGTNASRPGGFTRCGEEGDICQCEGYVWYFPDDKEHIINPSELTNGPNAKKAVDG
jgi:hypothetical protein